MIVTEIIPLDKRRCKVSFEENFALVLYRGEIKRYEIEEGRELAESRYDEIVETILCKRARERVIYLLKASDKTETELRRKLTEGGYPPAAVDYAIALCEKYGYINDENYTRHYIQQNKMRKSRRQLQYELQQKGISKQQIETALEEDQPDEYGQVKRLLEKKGYWREELELKDKQKLRMWLMRKGFSSDIVNHVMFCDS